MGIGKIEEQEKYRAKLWYSHINSMKLSKKNVLNLYILIYEAI